MKQSLKASIPKIESLITFTDLINNHNEQAKFIAFVDQTNPNHLKDLAKAGERYLLLIGPEGDFASTELDLALQNGFNKVSLGNSRLRTETAGVVGCHVSNLVNA